MGQRLHSSCLMGQRSQQDIRIGFSVERIAAVPYSIHTVLTDDGIQFFATLQLRTDGQRQQHVRSAVVGIQHRLTPIRHPWSNGQGERMNRSIKRQS